MAARDRNRYYDDDSDVEEESGMVTDGWGRGQFPALRNPTALQHAAFHGNADEVIQLLDSGVDVHDVIVLKGRDICHKGAPGRSAVKEAHRSRAARLEIHDAPLSWAVGGGQLEVVRILLARGADPNHRTKEWARPMALHWAVWYQHYAIATLLIEHGAAVDVHHWYLRRPLALLAGEPEPWSDEAHALAQLLIHRGASPSWSKQLKKSGRGSLFSDKPPTIQFTRSAVTCALLSKDATRFDAFVRLEGVNPLAACENEQTVLHLAAAHGRGETLKYLLHFVPTPVTVVNRDKETLFHVLHTSCTGDASVVSALVAAGVPLDAQDADWKGNNTALHLAVKNFDTTYVRLLLQAGADPSITNNRFETPVYSAIRVGAYTCVEAYLEAMMACAGTAKDTCIVPACIEVTTNIPFKNLPRLVHRGAPINGRDAEGKTGLHRVADRFSVYNEQCAVACDVLLSLGADPMVQDEIGDTALHTAARRQNLGLLLRLMQATKDAPLSVVNVSGDTIIHVLAHTNIIRVDIVRMLMSRGVFINAMNAEGHTPLHEVDSVKAAQILIQAGARVTPSYQVENTPLHEAYANDRRHICHVLFEHGADPSIRDLNGRLPYQRHPQAGVFPHGLSHERLIEVLGPRSPFAPLTEEELAKIEHETTTCDVLVESDNTFDGALLAWETAVEPVTDDTVEITDGQSADGDHHDTSVDTMGPLARSDTKSKDVPSKDAAAMSSKQATAETPNDAASWPNGANAQGGDMMSLHDAALSGDLETVLAWLDHTDVNILKYSLTPLHYACAGGHASVVELLLSRNADVSARDELGFTPLLMAIVHGHVSLLPLLIERGAEINVVVKGEVATTAHYAAAYDDDPSVLDAFVRCGGDVNASVPAYGTALHVACELAHVARVARLLAVGADPNVTYNFDVTPIGLAAFAGSGEIVEILLATGASPHSRSLLGLSVRAALSVRNSHKLQTRRIAPAASIPPRVKLSQHVRMLSGPETNNAHLFAEAIHAGDVIATATFIFGGNIDVNILPYRTGKTYLMMAALKGHLGVCSQLLDVGANIDEQESPGKETALTHAICKYHEATAIFLINFGANPSLANSDGATPLHQAVMRVLPMTVARLIAAGAPVNALDKTSSNALHYMARSITVLGLARQAEVLHDGVWRLRHRDCVAPYLSFMGREDQEFHKGSAQVAIVRTLVACGINIHAFDDRGKLAGSAATLVAAEHELTSPPRPSHRLYKELGCLPHEAMRVFRCILMLRLASDSHEIRDDSVNVWAALPYEVLEVVFDVCARDAIVSAHPLSKHIPSENGTHGVISAREIEWGDFTYHDSAIRWGIMERVQRLHGGSFNQVLPKATAKEDEALAKEIMDRMFPSCIGTVRDR